MSPWRIVAAADGDRLADRPGDVLGGALDADPPRPDRQPELDQLLDVAHRGVDQHPGGALRLGLGGQQIADEGHRPRLGHRQHDHLAGLDVGHHGVDHQVVVLAAGDRARRTGDPRAGDDLVQVDVDVAAAATGLVDGRRPEPGQLGERVLRHGVHRALTDLRDDPHERLGLADLRVPARPPGVVAAMIGALAVIGLQVGLGLHRAHRRDLGLHHGGDVDERRRREVAQLGLMGLEEEELRRLDRPERARHPSAGGQAAGPVDGRVGDRVIRVERVRVGVGDEHVGAELADHLGDLLERRRVDLQRVVTEIEAVEVGAQRLGGPLGLAVADALDVLDRLIGLLPQLARLAALAVGEGDHPPGTAGGGADRERAAGAPHEVGGVRADDQHPPGAHSGCAPATRRLLTTAITCTSSSLKPAASRWSTMIPIPSSTGGLNACPRSVDSTECS